MWGLKFSLSFLILQRILSGILCNLEDYKFRATQLPQFQQSKTTISKILAKFLFDFFLSLKLRERENRNCCEREKTQIETEARRQNNNKGMEVEESTVDWRGRPSNLNKHGGMKAAVFVLGISLYIHTHIDMSIYLPACVID